MPSVSTTSGVSTPARPPSSSPGPPAKTDSGLLRIRTPSAMSICTSIESPKRSRSRTASIWANVDSTVSGSSPSRWVRALPAASSGWI